MATRLLQAPPRSQDPLPTPPPPSGGTNNPHQTRNNEDDLQRDAAASSTVNNTENIGMTLITVGRLVEVASRTWPGINRPGGVARITRVYFETNAATTSTVLEKTNEAAAPTPSSTITAKNEESSAPTHVDVSYMVGRSREKRVPIEYVTLAPQYETFAVAAAAPHATNTSTSTNASNVSTMTTTNIASTSSNPSMPPPPMRGTGLRDRSLLLGRCRRCGSLRTDCGSCDWATEEAEQHQNSNTDGGAGAISCPKKSSHTSSERRSRNLDDADKGEREDIDGLVDSSGSSCSEDDDDDVALQDLLRTSRKGYRRHLRNRKRWNRLYGSPSPLDYDKDNSPRNCLNTEDPRQDVRHRNGDHQRPRQESNEPVGTAQEFDDDDDEEEEEDLEELWQRSQRKYRKHVRQRVKWQRRLETVPESLSQQVPAESSPPSSPSWLSKRQRSTNHHHHLRSVLETLDSNQSKRRGPNTTRRHSQEDPKAKQKSRRVTMDKRGQPPLPPSRDEVGALTSLAPTVNTPQKAGSSSRPNNQMNVDDSPIGVAESSSPEPSMDEDQGPNVQLDDDEDSCLDHAAPMDAEPRRISTYLEDLNNEAMAEDFPGMPLPADDPDNTFIQPEGREAAENLPDDMVDRTKSIPYERLPDFFNAIAQTLEDQTVPDFSLRLADIQRKHRRLSGPRRHITLGSNHHSTTENEPSVGDLLHQCHQMWTEVTQRVIRNGTDQCRAALRRLSDDRIFRKHRKNLTPEQRKKIRGTTIMDARNLRLDALEDSVETLVRNLKTAALQLEALQSEESQETGDIGDDDGDDDGSRSGTIGGSDAESEQDYETQDLVPLNQALSEDPAAAALDRCERPLGAFDPHQYATKRCTSKKRSHAGGTAEKTGSRHTKSRRTDSAMAHKQRVVRTSITPDDDFLVHDESTRRRPRTSQQVRSSQASAEERSSTTRARTGCSNVSRADLGSRTTDRDCSSEQQVHELNPESLDQLNDDETEDGAPSFDLFDTEASQDTVPSTSAAPTPSTSRGRPQRVAARQRRISQHPLESFQDFLHEQATSTQRRDRVPISQRMQEFLDKNHEFNWKHGDDGDDPSADDSATDGNPSSFRVDLQERRRRLAVQPTERGRRSHSAGDTSTRFSDETFEPRPTPRDNAPGRGNVLARLSGGDQISTDYLLSKFDATSSAPTNFSSVPPTALGAESRSSHAYPNDPVGSNRLLHQVQPASPSETNLAGSRPLVEMIACQSPQLGAHAQFLSSLVRNGGDTVLPGMREHFLSLVVLQLLDAVYALIHPTGWVVNIPNRVGILEQLEPIRDALAEAVPITEVVSRCIVEQLGCQEWRMGASGDFIYVSSLDPSVWSSFVQSGKYSIRKSESRYQKLGKVWPRVEVETAWNVLLFFGSSKSLQDQSNQARWQLITKLFSSSVLAKSIDEPSNLPPNPLQLAAFESDIDKFIRLLGKGTLDALPGMDKLVINLIKKGIVLQAEDYLGNEESRFCSFPAFEADKHTTKFIASLWKSTESLLLFNSSSTDDAWQTVYDLNFQLSKPQKKSPKVKSLLLPSSSLLGGCMSLLVAWAHRVPKKKVRQMRFLKQLKSLRESLIAQEMGPKDQTFNGPSADPFGDAFADSRLIQIGDSKQRTSLLFGESSAYLRILESLLAEKDTCSLDGTIKTRSLSLQTIKELWESLACDALRKHRQALADNSGFAEVGLNDPLQVFVAGRIMATATLLCMDISPWCLTATYPRRRLSVDVDEHKGLIEYYSFPISCVFACVDFLSRDDKNSALLCHLYSIVTILCNQLTVTVKLGGTNPSLNRVAAEATSIFMPVLVGCFRRHVDTSNEDTRHSCLLKLILGAIRSLSTFLGARRVSNIVIATPATVDDGSRNTMGDATDDFFDDLDDSIFASIETDMAPSGSPHVINNDTQSYWNCMKEVLVILKPSERFKISSSLDREETLSISPQSKYILNKEIDKVCNCLISMILAEKNDEGGESLPRDLIQLIRQSRRDSVDAEYEMKISARLSAQICLVSSEYEECRDFVAGNMDLFLINTIQTLLHSNRLGVFPSCNFEVIRKIGGQGAAREALAALDIFNGDVSSRPLDISTETFESIIRAQSRRKARADFPWRLIKNFGSAISLQFGGFAEVLKNIDCDIPLNYEGYLEAACLEKETFACFAFLRNVVSGLARYQMAIFEELCAHIVGFMASEVLRIVQGLRYFDQTSSTDSEETNPEKTKILSLLHAFSEIFFATAAWILRESPDVTTQKWKSLQNHLCESLFYPLLRRQRFDISLNLKRVVEACQSLSGAVPATSIPVSGIPGCDKYIEPFFDMALRRCRQLTVAPLQSSVLQNYMIEGIISSAETETEVLMTHVVGTCFSPSEQNDFVLSHRGPLQEELDRYLSFVESELPRMNSKRDMAEKRLETMRAVMIPKISQRKADLDAKRKILRVSTLIIANRNAFLDATTQFDMLELVTSFVRPLRHTFFQCMKSKSVDDDLVSVLFACAGNLAGLNVSNSSCSAEAVLSKVDDEVSQLDSCDLSILCQVEMRALYLHTFFRWMYTLASKIVTEESTSSNGALLSEVRDLCAVETFEPLDEHALSVLVLESSNNEGPAKLESWTRALACIENKLFASKFDNTRSVVNVYAKVAPVSVVTPMDDIENALEPWRLTSSVTRSAKEYMTAILSMSS